MKKLIAISVIFALVAGAAFAEVALGAEVFGKWGVEGGGDSDDATLFYGMPRARLSGSGQNDDGTIGANIRYTASGDGGGVGAFGWAWWKPIDQFRLQIGSNGGDGEFGLEGLTGWGFEALAYEVGMGNAPWAGLFNLAAFMKAEFDEFEAMLKEMVADGLITQDEADAMLAIAKAEMEAFGAFSFNRRSVFYSGWNAPGMWLQVAPIPEFVINVGLPGDGLAKDIFKSAHLQATYSLDGVGLFGVTYVGQGADVDGKIYVFADLQVVEDVALNFGFSYDLEMEILGVGAAVQMDVTDEFGFKAALTFLNADDMSYFIMVDALPYYKINETLTGFCSVGFVTFEDADEFTWMVNPYLKLSTGWCQDVYAGVKLTSIYGADADWQFIIGMTVGF